MFIAVQLWDDTDDEVVLQELADVLNTAKACEPRSFSRTLKTHLTLRHSRRIITAEFPPSVFLPSS